MSTNTASALLGEPPNNERDYYIIRGLDRLYGSGKGDPSKGSAIFPSAPPGYVPEAKATPIVIGLVIIMFTILITTVPRVALRASNPAMTFGIDDWAIIAAAVSYSSFHWSTLYRIPLCQYEIRH